MTKFDQYASPFSWRYGTPQMRVIWSEMHKRKLWREIWVALAFAQSEFGLIKADQVDELRAHVDDVDVKRAMEIESEINHDLMAEIKAFAEQCPTAGGIIHLGATSVDIKDNATALQIRSSLDVIVKGIEDLLVILTQLISHYADTPLIAFTHLQPAEPSTLGYRLAQLGQDLIIDFENLISVRDRLKGKGFKGAVGTSASYSELIGIENLPRFETRLSELLNLPFYQVTTQTYPRKQDFIVISVLAGMGASLNKMAVDIRFLQTPFVGELAEPFGARQVGSSAMPFKRNPIQAEKINSLARTLAQYPRIAWDNVALSLLERTMDDSANRRVILPEAFLTADELIQTTRYILTNLDVDEISIERNMDIYGPFAATERVLMALGKAGADRQEMHERLRQHSMKAWEHVRDGNQNPLTGLISSDLIFLGYLKEAEIQSLMDASDYVGDAPIRARNLCKRIDGIIGEFK
jgi:adenylosuccinate lyase